MRVLFVSPYIPSHIRIRPFAWIRALKALGCHVHLVALQPPEDAGLPEAPMRAVCDAMDVFRLSRPQTGLNGLRALATGVPLQAAYSRLGPAERRVRELLAGGAVDVVHIEHLRGSLLVPHPCPVAVVYDAVDCISTLFEQTARLAPGWKQRALARLDLARTRRFEAAVPFRFDRVAVSSEAEVEAFVALAGPAATGRVRAIPNGVEVPQPPPARRDDGRTVLFAGKMSYHANAATALRLARDIMPAVWAARPDARLVIAGKDPGTSIRALAADSGGRIEVTGYVPDMVACMAGASLLAAPLVYAAGIQNKVLEAMACGTPVITTPGAAAALGAETGRDLLVAGDEAAFAAAIVSLLADAGRRAAIGRAGRAHVEAAHQWPTMAAHLIALYREAMAAHREAGDPAASRKARSGR